MPAGDCMVLRERLHGLEGRMKRAEQTMTAAFASRQRALEGRLLSLSPLAVLNRGYALVFNESGVLIKSATQAAEGDLLTARLAMGSLQSRVIATEHPSDTKKTRRNTGPE